MTALKGALDDGYAEAVRKGLVGAGVKKAGRGWGRLRLPSSPLLV